MQNGLLIGAMLGLAVGAYAVANSNKIKQLVNDSVEQIKSKMQKDSSCACGCDVINNA